MKKIEIFLTNQIAFAGIYSCINCGKKLILEKESKLPKCSKCGLNKFTLDIKF